MKTEETWIKLIGVGIVIGFVLAAIIFALGGTIKEFGIGPVKVEMPPKTPTATLSMSSPPLTTDLPPPSNPTATFTPTFIPPTPTPTPPTPTWTPIPPTLTPTATSTPMPPDTSPGSSLEVGEVWRQDGMSLEIESYRFYAQYCTNHWSCLEPCCIEHSVAIAIEFILTNRTGQDILLDFDQLRFVVQDDAGKTYQVARTMQVGSDKQHTNTVSEILKNGQRYRIYIMFGDNITVTSHATQISVKVTTLSRIRNAAWIIKVPR